MRKTPLNAASWRFENITIIFATALLNRRPLYAMCPYYVLLYIFYRGKRPRSVHSPDMVKLRDMKLQSHHLVVVGGGAYVGTIMHVYP